MNTSSTGAPDGERFISPWIAASPLRFLLLAVALGSGAHTTLSAESSRFGVRAVPGTCGWYRVLPTVHREAAPIQSVRLGVSQDAETIVYTLDLCRTQATGPDLVSVQIRLILETSSNPPATPNWLRYQVWIPASGETYDYRNVHTDRALLPGWDRFDEQFLWIRDLDRTGQNAASQRYRRLLRATFDQIHAAFDNGKSFDIAVDDGRTPQGYRTVIRLTDSD